MGFGSQMTTETHLMLERLFIPEQFGPSHRIDYLFFSKCFNYPWLALPQAAASAQGGIGAPSKGGQSIGKGEQVLEKRLDQKELT
jgi:hypothetical protein